MSKSDDDVQAEFDDVMNMAPKELEDWLETDEAKKVGQKDGGGESTGHRSGRRIVEIKRKNKSDIIDDDIDHMRKVVSYVNRHLKQRPDGDVRETDWRYSLMNWGHDPKK